MAKLIRPVPYLEQVPARCAIRSPLLGQYTAETQCERNAGSGDVIRLPTDVPLRGSPLGQRHSDGAMASSGGEAPRSVGSMGWLTESAVQPRQARSIKVDQASVVNLKATLYAAEEELKVGGTADHRRKAKPVSVVSAKTAERDSKAAQQVNGVHARIVPVVFLNNPLGSARGRRTCQENARQGGTVPKASCCRPARRQ